MSADLDGWGASRPREHEKLLLLESWSWDPRSAEEIFTVGAVGIVLR